jgi:hypothetical protein
MISQPFPNICPCAGVNGTARDMPVPFVVPEVEEWVIASVEVTVVVSTTAGLVP